MTAGATDAARAELAQVVGAGPPLRKRAKVSTSSVPSLISGGSPSNGVLETVGVFGILQLRGLLGIDRARTWPLKRPLVCACARAPHSRRPKLELRERPRGS
jgi:hypothetical protein